MSEVGTLHKQVHIEHGEQTAEVDVTIAPLVLELWRAGIGTLASCQDFDFRGIRVVWVVLRSAEDRKRFLAIGRGLYWWPRVQEVEIDAEALAEAADPSANYLTAGSLTYQMIFPTEDLRHVLLRIRRHNKRGVIRLTRTARRRTAD